MKKYGLIIFFVWSIGQLNAQLAFLRVVDTRCEYTVNPLGIETAQPLLTWEIQAFEKNTMQAAYRILVSDDSMLLVNDKANIWDSKKVTSSDNQQVLPPSLFIKPATKYYWKVMVWDQKGQESSFSKPASWRTGLWGAGDWKGARWIAYSELPDSNRYVPLMHGSGKKEWGKRPDVLPLFRKNIIVKKDIKAATVFISGLGHFEMSVNGSKVGDHFLDPGWTQYAKQAQYVTFDITDQLRNGTNALGIMLGNGFYYIPGERYRKMTGAYGYPKMIARILIEYTDSTTEDIVSDASWKTAPSPVYFSSIYGGEDYDANLEKKGWDKMGFNDAAWQHVVTTTGPELVAQLGMPVKLMQRFTPVTQNKLRPGVWVYDLGQNFSGIPYIEVHGKKGDTIRIMPAELLTDSGTANQKHTGSPHIYTYILKGDGIEKWNPRFSYYGFRYLQVIGAEPKGSAYKEYPALQKIEGWHLRNSAALNGSFRSSSDLFNKTHQLIQWAMNSNFTSVFTDCPHREKLGWQEQVHLMGNAIQHNYDIISFAHKIMRDIRTQQLADGLVPATIPEFTEMHFADGYFRDSPEWGSTSIIFPWYMYQWTGDKRLLTENYNTMQRYFKYLQSKDSSFILMHGLSDWYDLGANRPGFSQLTPMGLTATAYYYYDAHLLEQVATTLGKKEDAILYQKIASDIKAAFNRKYFNPSTKQYGSGNQTSNAIPLFMNLVEPQDYKAVLAHLVEDIRSKDNRLTAGDIGYRYVLKALEAAGRSDVIYDMNSRSDVPGYGYQLAKGATALTESWQALPNVSNNHFMLGHLMEWFYTGLCGIGQAPGSVGFKDIEIKPQPVGDIKDAKATYHSVNGLISVNWKIEGATFNLSVAIPPNSKATIYFPAEYKKQPVRIGSGAYQFSIKK